MFTDQNIFGYSEDSWNHCTDEEFWKEDYDSEYPLLFVVFLQLSNCMADSTTIEQQCRAFNGVLQNSLEEGGKYYTYGTIDKNDFVVCIRCRNHTQALNAIKKLHNTHEYGFLRMYTTTILPTIYVYFLAVFQGIFLANQSLILYNRDKCWNSV